MRLSAIFAAFFIIASCTRAHAVLQVDPADPAFAQMAQKEIGLMRSGDRGLVCRSLVERLDLATATTTVHALTSDESTWHPNDRKGTRSHTVARDTRVHGAQRNKPTDADIYVQPARVDPSMSLFKLGSFVNELSQAADLNEGVFSADFKTREKRSAFYRNAWLDALGFKPISVSDRIPTPEYAQAKAKGLLTEAYASHFPLVGPISDLSPVPTATPAP